MTKNKDPELGKIPLKYWTEKTTQVGVDHYAAIDLFGRVKIIEYCNDKEMDKVVLAYTHLPREEAIEILQEAIRWLRANGGEPERKEKDVKLSSCQNCSHFHICSRAVEIQSALKSAITSDEYWIKSWKLVAEACQYYSKEQENERRDPGQTRTMRRHR